MTPLDDMALRGGAAVAGIGGGAGKGELVMAPGAADMGAGDICSGAIGGVGIGGAAAAIVGCGMGGGAAGAVATDGAATSAASGNGFGVGVAAARGVALVAGLAELVCGLSALLSDGSAVVIRWNVGRSGGPT
jgi:hypothetical protein